MQQTSAQFDRASRWLLLVVVAASALALGSIPPPALLVVTALATLGAAAALFGRRLAWSSVPAPAWVILSLTLLTLLQLLKLPAFLQGALAPANRDAWDAAFSVLDETTPRWLPTSLDPGATWLEVAKGWLYACIFITAAGLGARRGAGYGATALFGCVLVFALVCLGHGLVEATRVFGVYQPSTRGTGFSVAPLLNANNRASYLNFGALCAFSLLAMRHPPVSRWLPGLSLPLFLGISLLTGSRGGILGLAAGLIVLLVLLRPKLMKPRGDAIAPAHLLAMGAGLVLLGALFAAGAAGPRLKHLLFEQGNGKLAVMATAMKLVPAHFWLGIGRGSFESVFPALRTSGNTIASHPENFLVQWLTEWGVPGALLALVAFALLLRPRNWGVHTSIPACGLFAATLSLVVQNLFDLGSEVPGVVVAGIAAAGVAWGARTGKLSRSPRRRLLLPVVALVLGALLLRPTYVLGRDTLERDRESLVAELAAKPSWTAFRGSVRAAMLRHPAEPYFPRLAAIAAWRDGRQNPVPWINHALNRGLSAGRTHYLLGAYLASRGHRPQALLELRLAASFDETLVRPIATMLAGLTQDEHELLRAVPEGEEGARLLLALSKNLSAVSPELSTNLLRQAASRDPNAGEVRLSLVRRLLEDVERRAASCADAASCLKEAQRLLDGAEAGSTEAIQLRARLLMEQDNAAEAVKLLNDECPRASRRMPCISSWVEAAKRARDRRALHQAMAALESEDCSGSRCAGLYWAAGLAGTSLGDRELALQYLERGATSQGSVARWREVARISREHGQFARAAAALSRARALSPNDAALTKEFDSLRHDTVEQLLRK